MCRARRASPSPAAALGGCSLGDDEPAARSSGADRRRQRRPREKLGFPSTATRNTIRVGGGDAGADAAGVASARLPGHQRRQPAARPWCWWTRTTGRAASRPRVLAGPPIGAPMLLSDGGDLPAVTADTLERLKPTGSDLSKDAQVIRIGDARRRGRGLQDGVIEGDDAYERAAAIDRFFSAARGKPSARRGASRPASSAEYAMPAAAWAARSGDAVLFTRARRGAGADHAARSPRTSKPEHLRARPGAA